MSEPSSALRSSDESTALAVITSAFADDPVERWLYPDDSYQREFPGFVLALGGQAFEARTAWSVADESAALWLPPGIWPDDEAIVEVLTRTVAPSKHADMYDGLDQMAQAHPEQPCWYLAWLGVDGSAQNRGLGSRLLARSLERVDASHEAAYLETPNPRTIPFYERHGFTNMGQTHAGSCPPITFMHRPAR